MNPASLWQRYLALSTHYRVILALFAVILAGELILGKGFPRSRAYRAWKGFFAQVGEVWAAVLLSFIYFVSVGPVALGMKLAGTDLLDKAHDPQKTAWHPHEKNPLGPLAAARHQF